MARTTVATMKPRDTPSLLSPRGVVGTLGPLLNLNNAKQLVFWYIVQMYLFRLIRHIRARGILPSVYQTYVKLVNKGFALVLLLVPSARQKVESELNQVSLDLAAKLAPHRPELPARTQLPAKGLTREELTAVLDKLAAIPNTKWETGRVSGAVYNGSEEMSQVWVEAFSKFEVSNPLHADVFPGVRQMDADVVKMCLTLFNSPLPSSIIDQHGGAGTTTSGGTESILMACLAYRQRAAKERNITRPEMIIPASAHAAFVKAANYFKIKCHVIPVDVQTRKVNLKLVKKAINKNTIFLVGSAPNFPDGIIDDITKLSDLALKHNLGLHVDCCLGSFIVPFLERAGFETDPFDFRVPGVTSISCDVHKYSFAPKGSSVIMYKSKSLRKHQYSIMGDWAGGTYASPSMAGSRAGAVIAGAWASLMFVGENGYLQSCQEIVGAQKRIAHGIRSDFPELFILGDPKASVVAFGSKSLPIYEVGDRMDKLGWHLNALQNPAALHIACTKLTVPAVEDLLKDLRKAVDSVKGMDKPGTGSMVMLYGLGSSSAVGPGLVEEMATRYMDVLYH